MTSDSEFPDIHADDTMCLTRRVNLTLSREPSQEGLPLIVSINNLTANWDGETYKIPFSSLGGNLNDSTRFEVLPAVRITFKDSDTVVHVPLSNTGEVEGRWAVWDSNSVHSYEPSATEIRKMLVRLDATTDRHNYAAEQMILPIPNSGHPPIEAMAYVKRHRAALVPSTHHEDMAPQSTKGPGRCHLLYLSGDVQFSNGEIERPFSGVIDSIVDQWKTKR
uniref:Uncharacterized protein n=1 Tax=Kwoniella bestiolae CBS 10118 TaxID=1296100 RepID=A0A1B9FYS7_9TREE|nr:hypothetical protein I302_06914 [Kwoniella bestiolae CBS 10118]OCF23928.1 hypothetical protein I302_06914 [Kwoniella bestiolae CBS 10118]